ncbi:flagellar biosynthesis protein FlhF [Govanella unica]|uniref:Flagella-associated GTP-binding protein n=1 Tax=Govanella unica TaxID=2975056 RepID=A0A9X3Z6K2_9PROT|nr:hypothetical protein [Govania unica]MDA5193009.1 hypothetical protein [Govania unica]
MRLKTFSANSMQDAMAQVRKSLGPDAIIISSRERDESGLVHVTAALDREPVAERAPPTAARGPHLVSPPDDALRLLLAHHRLPEDVHNAILKSAAVIDDDDPVMALAAAFDGLLHFLPFEDRPIRPLMLIGAPGAGKTVTLAKLAADAILAGRSVAIITADTLRAGAIDQIRTYAKILEIPAVTAATPQALADAVREAEAADHDLILIDTPGINAYDRDDLATLQSMLDAIDAEPVLVAAAGMDAVEAHEFSMLYADLGCRRFIATKLDTARRFGSLLAFSHGGPLAIAGATASPFIGDRLSSLNPVSMARLIAATPKKTVTYRSSSSKTRVQS